MFQILNLDGQKGGYDDQNKALFVEIREPFYAAGKLLHWPEPSTVGLGLNKTIIDVLLKMKCHLVVRVVSAGASYWCDYDRIKKFLAEHQCSYTISGKTLKVISWKLFVRLGEHSE